MPIDQSPRIIGGVFQDFAPSPFRLQHVPAPLLGRMGVKVDLRVLRAGYVPTGSGEIELQVKPAKHTLDPLTLVEQGILSHPAGITFSSHLQERQISERMAQTCEEQLAGLGLTATIERVSDTAASHPGASLAVWATSTTGAILGADRAGAPRRSSEAIGRSVATMLREDIATGATVDRHVTDQLVLFAALARGTSHYLVPCRTDHLDSNLWLIEQFGARMYFQEREVAIDGVGYRQSS